MSSQTMQGQQQFDLLIIQHPISLYFVEASGIVAAFKKLFESYQQDDKYIHLDPVEDKLLIDRFEQVMPSVFPITRSSVELGPWKRRLNMYYRRFGHLLPEYIEGYNDFPGYPDPQKPNVSNDDDKTYYTKFRPDFTEIMVKIFNGKYDQNTDAIKLAVPAQLKELLNDMRDNLRTYNINNVDRITCYWTVVFQELLRLLNDEHFMKALNIRQNTSLNDRLKEFGSIVNVPVSKVLRSHIILSQRMAAFLKEIQDTTEWTDDKAALLYTDPENLSVFDDIDLHWHQLYPNEAKFSDMALKYRAGGSTGTEPSH